MRLIDRVGALSMIIVIVIAVIVHLHPGSLLVGGATPAEAHHAPREGFGADTPGGTGQSVYRVTSLGDSGAGTLRDAVSSGFRYIRFDVAGDIVLSSPVMVRGPFVTIDGFSAPSPGITLRQAGLRVNGAGAHDIIVQGIRIRDAHNSSTADCLGIGFDAFNVVIDHVSASGCSDGAIDVTHGAHDVTVQWSILHSTSGKNMLAGSGNDSTGASKRISVHHNLFIGAIDRNPSIRHNNVVQSDTIADVRNNVVWNYGGSGRGSQVLEEGKGNLVANLYGGNGDPARAIMVMTKSNGRAYLQGNVWDDLAPIRGSGAVSTESQPFRAPFVTTSDACPAAHEVVAAVGVRPLDRVDAAHIAAVKLPTCPGGGTGGGGSTPTQEANLVPRSVSAPGSVAAGQTVSVTGIIANTGTATAPSTTASLYLSTSSRPAAGDPLLGSVPVPSLAAGASHTLTTNVTVPAATEPDDYMLALQVNGIAVAIPMAVTTGGGSPGSLPDLVVLRAGRPSSVRRGGAFTVEFTVENQGEAPAPASDVRLYLSTDRTLSSNDIDLGVVSPTRALAPGGRQSTYDVPVRIERNVRRGDYYLLFVIDGLRRIPESDEANNTAPRSMTVR